MPPWLSVTIVRFGSSVVHVVHTRVKLHVYGLPNSVLWCSLCESGTIVFCQVCTHVDCLMVPLKISLHTSCRFGNRGAW